MIALRVKEITVIIYNERVWFNNVVKHPKDADGIAKSVD